MSLRWPCAVVVALAVAGCANPPAGDGTPGSAHPAATTPRPSVEESHDPAANPGRPYDGDALLVAMRASRRPGGVPAALQTKAIAAEISQQVWTWDGRPWLTISIGGACGPATCSLDVAGSVNGTAGADLYAFSVDPGDGTVTLVTSDLHGYPAGLDTVLERTARDAAGDALGSLAFAAARWLPPPDGDRYWVAFRTGGEEGAPGKDLLIDLASGELIETRTL